MCAVLQYATQVLQHKLQNMTLENKFLILARQKRSCYGESMNHLGVVVEVGNSQIAEGDDAHSLHPGS